MPYVCHEKPTTKQLFPGLEPVSAPTLKQALINILIGQLIDICINQTQDEIPVAHEDNSDI